MELLSPQRQILPFDERRDGLILGEACAALMLAKNGTASMRYLGGACNTDSFSLTAANIDGSTIAAVMKQALADADRAAEDVTAVKVHGTASLLNDEAEAAGLLNVFDSADIGLPTTFALKPYVGHTLGACGAVEIALVHSAAMSGFIPANEGVASKPSELGVQLNQNTRDVKSETFVLNYFAFGGNNTSLIFEYGVQ